METNPEILARRRKRQRLDRLFRVTCLLAAMFSVGILLVLLFSILRQGITYLDWGFLTGVPSRKPEDAGFFPAMVGSIMIGLVCALSALPIGVGTAILLHEFTPKSRILRKLHHVVDLNITNLAGVPSVVYGLLGLTVFANMFGVYGTSLDPAFEWGVTYFDQFYDETGAALKTAPLDKASEPTPLTDGMRLYHAETGERVTVRVVEGAPDDPQLGMVRAGDEAQRLDARAWYYLQLPLGRGVLAGGLTLMLVVLPVVIVAAQESLRAVPNSLRQGALAMGCTRWQMVWNMTLPSALPGIMTGMILAFSRAIGEAAPILILTGIVYITFTPTHLMDDFTAMPLQIYQWAGLPQEEFHRVAASGIIVLLTILLCFNAVAILIRQKFTKAM